MKERKGNNRIYINSYRRIVMVTISAILGLLNGYIIFSNFSGQIKLSDVEKYHFLSVAGDDTVFFASTTENDKLKGMGRGCLFFKRSSGSSVLLEQEFFGDSYTLEFIVDDFSGDGVNDVLTLDMDEAYYSITIFQIKRIDRKFSIEKSYQKGNLYIPKKDVPGTIHNILQVGGRGKAGKPLKFFYADERNEIHTLVLKFDSKTKRWLQK
jgi:hypothetical protein